MAKIVTRTTATNKKLRELLVGIRQGTLIPNPEFQRRLVWTNKHKVNFLKTVLGGYPFPEIYTAAGSINPDTGEGTEMLVDGQQRITTLNQYFTGSDEIQLPRDVPLYNHLDDEAKRDFLDYIVVVRDLGNLTIEEIKEVFTRINSTGYSLNAMEINNARYEGEYKKFAQELAEHPFFEKYYVFKASETRRMDDISYALTLVTTILTGYFNRVSELEGFLNHYNDDFPEGDEIKGNIETIFGFIDSCDFERDSRLWKKADLFSVIIELYRAIIEDGFSPNRDKFKEILNRFFYEVDNRAQLQEHEFMSPREDIDAYAEAILQGTNDRSKRIERGSIIKKIIRASS